MADLVKDAALDLNQLLGRSLAVTAKDGRLFIGLFHCTDRQMNIILMDTQEFPPAPKNGEEIKRKEWEEIWLPRSQKLEDETDWTPWANLPATPPTDPPSNPTVGSSSTRLTVEHPERETGCMKAHHRDGKGSVIHPEGGGGNTTQDVDGLDARGLEKAQPTEDHDSEENIPAGAHKGKGATPVESSTGSKWGHGRRPGRFVGMSMIPGHQVAKVELVHGAEGMVI